VERASVERALLPAAFDLSVALALISQNSKSKSKDSGHGARIPQSENISLRFSLNFDGYV
jgi:hypothetical protein